RLAPVPLAHTPNGRAVHDACLAEISPKRRREPVSGLPSRKAGPAGPAGQPMFRRGLRSNQAPTLTRTPPSAMSGMLLSVLVDGSVCTPPTTVCDAVVLCAPVCVVPVFVGEVCTPATTGAAPVVVALIELVIVARFALA